MTKFIDKAPVRFLIAGLVNTLIGYLLYLLLLLILPYQAAYTTSYGAGIFISYYLNSVYVFQRPLRWSSAVQYPLVYLVQYVTGLVTISLLVEQLSVDTRIASLLTILITLPLVYILSRAIIRR